MSHKKGKSILSNVSLKASERFYINKDPSIMLGWNQDGDNANVFASLRFVQYNHQCFSDWSKSEMRSFWDFSEKLHKYTWRQVYDQSRKNDKSGLGLTNIDISKYPKSDFLDQLDPLINIFELRVSAKARVHCFRNKSVCYICWLDKDHTLLS